jgi:hypothetical protein
MPSVDVIGAYRFGLEVIFAGAHHMPRVGDHAMFILPPVVAVPGRKNTTVGWVRLVHALPSVEVMIEAVPAVLATAANCPRECE